MAKRNVFSNGKPDMQKQFNNTYLLNLIALVDLFGYFCLPKIMTNNKYG